MFDSKTLDSQEYNEQAERLENAARELYPNLRWDAEKIVLPSLLGDARYMRRKIYVLSVATTISGLKLSLRTEISFEVIEAMGYPCVISGIAERIAMAVRGAILGQRWPPDPLETLALQYERLDRKA